MSRIFAISDLHTDYEANMEFVESLPPRPEDVLIVAGDVSDDIPRLNSVTHLILICISCIMI